jgi:hypothetical protein
MIIYLDKEYKQKIILMNPHTTLFDLPENDTKQLIRDTRVTKVFHIQWLTNKNIPIQHIHPSFYTNLKIFVNDKIEDYRINKNPDIELYMAHIMFIKHEYELIKNAKYLMDRPFKGEIFLSVTCSPPSV